MTVLVSVIASVVVKVVLVSDIGASVVGAVVVSVDDGASVVAVVLASVVAVDVVEVSETTVL